jgi:hypothetical protein
MLAVSATYPSHVSSHPSRPLRNSAVLLSANAAANSQPFHSPSVQFSGLGRFLWQTLLVLGSLSAGMYVRDDLADRPGVVKAIVKDVPVLTGILTDKKSLKTTELNETIAEQNNTITAMREREKTSIRDARAAGIEEGTSATKATIGEVLQQKDKKQISVCTALGRIRSRLGWGLSPDEDGDKCYPCLLADPRK